MPTIGNIERQYAYSAFCAAKHSAEMFAIPFSE